MLYPPKFGSDPLFPQSSDFAVVEKDPQVGKGVITYRDFKKGEVIAKMAGDVVSVIKQHTLQIDAKRHLHDTYFSGYFLHSCDPNIFLDMQEMKVIALKPIRANSYLYMDYAQTEDVLFRQFPCSCGARSCRGWITGKAEVPYDMTADMPLMEMPG